MIAFKNQELLTKIVQLLFFCALAVVVTGTVIPNPPVQASLFLSDKVLHFMGYLGLGLLGGTGWPVRRLSLLFWLPLFGIALEFVQGAFLPWRYFEWLDAGANAAGAILGIAASVVARRILFMAP